MTTRVVVVVVVVVVKVVAVRALRFAGPGAKYIFFLIRKGSLPNSC